LEASKNINEPAIKKEMFGKFPGYLNLKTGVRLRLLKTIIVFLFGTV
jgi:hypothetical protein